MLRAAISLLAAIMLIATCHAVELQESVSVSAMHVTLIPGSSRVLVQEARQIDYAASEQSVAFAYGQARIAVDSVRISPPNGVTVEATHRPAGRDDCVIWDLAGRPVSPSPTRISYELEGLDWKLLYRLDFNPASTTGHSGTATVSAAIEVCNQSGLDLRATSLSLALNGAPDEGCSLRVAGGLRDLPTGWTKQWPVVTADGDSSIATDLAAHVQYVYAPQSYSSKVQRLLVLSESEQAPLPVPLLSLPEGPVDIYLHVTDQPGSVPDAIAIWRTTAARSGVPGGSQDSLTFELGPEPAIAVEDTTVALRKENVTFDARGQVAGMDVVEQHQMTVTNRADHDAELALYQEVLSKWKLDLTSPTPDGENAETDQRDRSQIRLWSGTLLRGETVTIEFTLTRPLGVGQ